MFSWMQYAHPLGEKHNNISTRDLNLPTSTHLPMALKKFALKQIAKPSNTDTAIPEDHWSPKKKKIRGPSCTEVAAEMFVPLRKSEHVPASQQHSWHKMDQPRGWQSLSLPFFFPSNGFGCCRVSFHGSTGSKMKKFKAQVWMIHVLSWMEKQKSPV